MNYEHLFRFYNHKAFFFQHFYPIGAEFWPPPSTPQYHTCVQRPLKDAMLRLPSYNGDRTLDTVNSEMRHVLPMAVLMGTVGVEHYWHFKHSRARHKGAHLFGTLHSFGAPPRVFLLTCGNQGYKTRLIDRSHHPF